MGQDINDFYPMGFFKNPQCPLDEFFGRPIQPERIDPFEIMATPASLTELSKETAELVSRYLQTAVDGLKITRVAHDMLPILWVIDEDGRIYLSLEEVYEEEGERCFPLARGIKVPKGFRKLGHPSLIQGEVKNARIGGELIFDPDPEIQVPGWVITNSSGRFGYGAHRVERHLRNASIALAAFGIVVDISYAPPVN